MEKSICFRRLGSSMLSSAWKGVAIPGVIPCSLNMIPSPDPSHRFGGLWFGPAEMPVLFKQRHIETFMIGMSEHFIQDQIHTQARAFRNFNVSVHNFRRIGDKLFL